MFNTTQGGYVLPYQSRLDSMNQERNNPFGLDVPNASLPLQRPGSTQGPLPPAMDKPDPMEEAKKSDYYKANQAFMQNPEYAKTFEQLSSEAVALRDQVQKGYMPETIAQQRIQEKVFALRDDMMRASQSQPEQKPQSAPQGALSGVIQEDPSRGIMMKNEDGSPVLDDNGEPIYEVPAGSGDEGPSTEELENEAMTGGLAGEDVPEQQAQAAQAPQQQPIVDPRFLVTDPTIQAIAQSNMNRATGVGDTFGNVLQPEAPTESQMANAQLSASGQTLSDMANQPKDWWSNEPFVYSSIRYLVGLLSGEDAASAFSGAGQSYQQLSGMEKRQQYADELEKQGYSKAQIEEYIRTGNSKVLQDKKWSNVGQGIAMSTGGDFMKIPGYDPNFMSAKDIMNYQRLVQNDQFRNQLAMMNYDRMNQYQQAQLDISRQRLDLARNRPETLRAVELEDGSKVYLNNAQIEEYMQTNQLPQGVSSTFGMRKANPELIKEGWYQDMSKEFNSKKYQQYQKGTTWRNIYFDSIKKHQYKPLEMDALDTILGQAATEGGNNGVTWTWLKGKMAGDQFLALKDAMLATIPDLREDSGAAINLGEYRTELHALAHRPGESMAALEGRAIANTLSRAIGHNREIKPKDVSDIRQDFMARAVDPRTGRTIVKVKDPSNQKGYRYIPLPL